MMRKLIDYLTRRVVGYVLRENDAMCELARSLVSRWTMPSRMCRAPAPSVLSCYQSWYAAAGW